MTDTSLIDDEAEAFILALVEEGIFNIDEQGRIWRRCIKRGRVIKPVLPEPRRAEFESSNGYLRIRVSTHGVRIRVSAHRVVYRFFHGDIPEGHVVNHKDRDRQNNHPSNLEAVTQSENVRHALCTPPP